MSNDSDVHSLPAAEAGSLPVAVGARLREIRQERRETLRHVAGAIGISPSLLSQVETGKTQPSVGTLYSLVTFYGISLDAVLGQDVTTQVAATEVRPRPLLSGNPIQRAGQNPRIEMEDGVTWERLAVAGQEGVEPLLVTYAPGASSSYDGKWTRHEGVEYGYLMSGSLTLHLEFETYAVEAGDSICFDSTRPHYYVNESDEPARSVFFVLSQGGAQDLPESARHGSVAQTLAALSAGGPVEEAFIPTS